MHQMCTERADGVQTSRHTWRAAVAFAAAVFATPVPAGAEEAIALPSGHSVVYNDVIWGEPGPAGLTIRFRFLDPDLATRVKAAEFIDMETDTAFLCESYALERITSSGPQPNQIIISIADREVDFGEPAPEATQIFEAYSFDGSTCTWEGF